jgi:cytochrome c biogenesis factor
VRHTASQALVVAFALTALAALGLEWALLRSDLWLRYVAEHTARNLPVGYRLAALVTGPAGALLVLALMVSGSATAAIIGGRTLQIADRPWALVTLAVAVVALLAPSAMAVSPFERLAWLPLEGSGMLPRLQTPTGVLRPLLGLSAIAMLVVPAALAVDALVRRSTGPEWWSFMTRWLLAAWVVQSVALALGFWGVLREPSWPQLWGREALLWGSLPPWLLTAACLVFTQRRRPRPRASRLAGWTLAAGALAVAVGLAGSRVARSYTVALGQGQVVALRDTFGAEWTFAQQGVSAFRMENREVTAVTLEGVRQGGRRVLLVTERRQSVDSRDEEIFEPVVTIAVASGPLQDIAVTLERTLPGDVAELRVEFRPFESWIWVGCALVITAGLVAWVGSSPRDA